jgi:chromosome partitioning protein
MTTIAIYNLKGGVGKTASCVNLAYLAAADGFKTLLWDVDQQGSSSFYYKVKPKQHTITKSIFAKESAVKDSILKTDFEMLDILPSDNTAQGLDSLQTEMQNGKNKIKNVLKEVQKDYDFVFLDCPPGFTSLSENIIAAADVVLMPVIPTTLSIRTYNMVKDYIKERNLDASKMTCFFTMVDLRKTLHNDIMEELYKDKRFFQNYIPYLSDVEKMGIHKSPIMEYANSSYAAKCYRELWAEIKEGVL